MLMSTAECSYEKTSIDDDEGFSLLPNDSLIGQRRANLRNRLSYWLWVLAQLFFVISYALLIFLYLNERGQMRCLLGQEAIYDDPPIKYETVIFQQTGFHDLAHNHRTVYEGRPDAKNNNVWDNLMSVGIASISEKEDSRLFNGSAKSQRNSQEHVVELEVFHQLHCLKSLRKQLWEFEDGSPEEEDASRRQQHFDHCIDYLRQVIMCHGDLTPIIFEWNSEIDSYIAHHSTLHTCRNFDAIFDWASERNTAGMTIDGKHENKEFSTPESFD